MSIVKGTQQRMFAVPAGQAASRGQLSGRSEWKGTEGRRKKKGPTIKKRKRVLFQALSYKHLEEGGGALQTSEAWRGGRLSLTFPRSPSQKGCLRWHSSNISTASYHPAIHPTDLPPTHPHPHSPIYCTGCHTGISVGSSKISSRQRQKQRNASLALSSKTNSAALTDSWLAGCEGFQSVGFLVWSAYPMASMIHNVVRNTSYLEKKFSSSSWQGGVGENSPENSERKTL